MYIINSPAAAGDFLLYGVRQLILPVNPKQPFVYIDTLQSSGPWGQYTWDRAVNLVQQLNGQMPKNADERLLAAINFLKNIAAQQLGQEQLFIQNKIQELKANNIQTPTWQQNIEKLKKMLNNATNEGINYPLFAALLNNIMKEEEEYRARLRSLINNKNKNSKKNKQLGLLKDIDDEFKAVINLLSGATDKISNQSHKYSQTMSRVIKDWIIKQVSTNSSITQNLSNPRLFEAAIIGLQVDLRKYLEMNEELSNFTDAKLTERIAKAQTLFQKYLDNRQSYINDLFNDTHKLQQIADEFDIQLANNVKTNKDNATVLNIKLPPQSSIQINPTIVFNKEITLTQFSERLGALFDNFSNIHKHTGRLNRGDDMMYGTIFIEHEDDLTPLEEEMTDTLNQLYQFQRDFINIQKDRNNYLTNQQQLFQKMEDALVLLDKTYQKYGEKTHGFIIHESDKYYTSIEQGNSGRYNTKTKQLDKGFHGRSINILNYIDTMFNIGMDFGLNIDNLRFTALNLGQHSPGAHMINTLEELFTYAAALIMFDDTSIIVKEATKQLGLSNIHNLHLYKLQQLYFPGSYIIQQTAEYLENNMNQLNNAAVAHIDAPESGYAAYYHHYAQKDRGAATKKFMESNPLERWNLLRDITASETRVSIQFFMNFQNFLESMKNY